MNQVGKRVVRQSIACDEVVAKVDGVQPGIVSWECTRQHSCNALVCKVDEGARSAWRAAGEHSAWHDGAALHSAVAFRCPRYVAAAGGYCQKQQQGAQVHGRVVVGRGGGGRNWRLHVNEQIATLHTVYGSQTVRQRKTKVQKFVKLIY